MTNYKTEMSIVITLNRRRRRRDLMTITCSGVTGRAFHQKSSFTYDIIKFTIYIFDYTVPIRTNVKIRNLYGPLV